MATRLAPARDRSALLPLLPGLTLTLGLLRQGFRVPGDVNAALVLTFAAWGAGFVLLARLAAGRDGALVAAASGGLAAAGLVVTLVLDSQRASAQLLLWTVASGLALVAAAIPWQRVVRYPRIVALLSLGLLLLPLVAGVEVGGARAWVRWGDFHFQPGELARILGVLLLAGWLVQVAGAPPKRPRSLADRAGPEGLGPAWRAAVPLGAVWLLLTGLWIAQRDLGGAALSYVLFPLAWLLAGGGWPVFALATAFGIGGGLGLLTLFPHASTRVVGWVPPWGDLSTTAYQEAQGLVSLRLGGLWGDPVGGAGAAVVPAAATDLPLAVVAQGAGVLAVWGILYLEWCIVDRGLRAAGRAEALPVRLLAGATALLWAVEVLVPIAGWLGLVPLTGVPLPLVSRGGTALLAHGLMLGWLLWGLRHGGARERSAP